MHRSIHILFTISEFFPFPFPLALIYTKMASEDVTDGKISSVICCQTRESPPIMTASNLHLGDRRSCPKMSEGVQV